MTMTAAVIDVGDAGWPPLLGIAAAFLLVVSVRLLKQRSASELRVRLLEVLAPAVRRNLPLPAFVQCAVAEAKGRDRVALQRFHRSLDEGQPLHEALARGGRRIATPDVAAAVGAASGGPGLPDLLDALAVRSMQTGQRRHRAAMTFLYPALLGLVLALIAAPLHLFEVIDVFEVESARRLWDAGQLLFTGALVTIVAGLALYVVARRLRWWPESSVSAASRWLAAVAPLAGAGRPFAEALRAAAGVCRDRRSDRALHLAAAALDDGAGLDEVVGRLPAPATICARLAAALRREPAAAARSLRALADECATRHDARIEHRLRWSQPLLLLVLGATIALQYGALIECWLMCIEEAKPW